MDGRLRERPSESKRLVLTSLPHQLQPAVWLGRNPHHCLFKATKHKLGVSEVIQGRKCKALAFPVGVTPVDWLLRVPCGWRCHSYFIANTTSVIQYSHTVLHSRRLVARMESKDSVFCYSLHSRCCSDILSCCYFALVVTIRTLMIVFIDDLVVL